MKINQLDWSLRETTNATTPIATEKRTDDMVSRHFNHVSFGAGLR
jgi:hypothetical protein